MVFHPKQLRVDSHQLVMWTVESNDPNRVRGFLDAFPETWAEETGAFKSDLDFFFGFSFQSFSVFFHGFDLVLIVFLGGF